VEAPTGIPGPGGSAALERLLRNFASDMVRHRQLIRELLDSDREAFLAHTIEILKTDTDSRGVRYLMSLLLSENLLFEALGDPALDRQQAVALARIAVRVDPMTDVALARWLASTVLSDPDARSIGAPGRLMEILGEISPGPRILPCLMPLLRSANPFLRSQAVRMIGRGIGNVKWVRSRLTETDTRVRANAVEGLWSVESEESREMLRQAARDGNDRVAGNALLGLYCLGDCAAMSALLQMVGHPSSLFRKSAAWAMGATTDPRFSEVLGSMLADPDAGVRKRAFAAVSQIKAASARLCANPAWRVFGRVVREGRGPCPALRSIRVTLVANDGHEHPHARPTQFILTEDGQAVWSYEVREEPLPEAMSVVFVFPRSVAADVAPWTRAALQCLERKRPVDLWCSVPYVAGEDGGTADDANPELPRFTSYRGLMAAALTHTPKRSDCTCLWSTLERIVHPENTSVCGMRHIIAFVPAEIEKPAGCGLATAVLSSRSSLQIVSNGPNPALEELCVETGGGFQIGASDAEIEELVARAYWNLVARYQITYQPVCPHAATIRLRVHSPQGWGEVSIRV